MSRCASAAIVPNTSELLPEPETPVNTVSRRLGISTLTSLRLFSRAPRTRIMSWPSAGCRAGERMSGILSVEGVGQRGADAGGAVAVAAVEEAQLAGLL